MSVRWQSFETYGVVSYGSDSRKDVVNQGLELDTHTHTHTHARTHAHTHTYAHTHTHTHRALLSGTFLHTLAVRIGCVYAIEGTLFISVQLSIDAVSALRKVWVLIKLWKQNSVQARK